MRLILLRVNSKINDIKNSAGSIEGKEYENKNEFEDQKTNGSGSGYAARGNYYRNIGNCKKAEAMYEKAIKADPADRLAYLGLADSYENTARYEESGKIYMKAIEINPNNSRGYVNLGDWYAAQGRNEEAEKLYRKAIEINHTGDDLGYIRLGNLYRSQGKYKDAEKLYIKVLGLNPKPKKDYYLICGIYELEHKYDEAAKILKAWMKQENENEMRSDKHLRYTFNKEGKDIEFRFKKINEESRSIYFGPGTIYNYKKLGKILKERNIKYVCVQYPMREIADLKGIFKGDTGIVFVDNEKIFKGAVEKEGYNTYFWDKFAGDFGHCTVTGDRLLAENTADSIIKEVLHK